MAQTLSNLNTGKAINLSLVFIIAIMIGLVINKLIAFSSIATQTNQKLSNIVEQQTLSEDEKKEILEKSKSMASDLKEKNPFSPPPPKPGMPTVSGLLGNEALINGQWHKVGSEVNGAKILAITATGIKIKWKGKTQTISPNLGEGGRTSFSPGPGKRGDGERRKRGNRRRGGRRQNMSATPSTNVPADAMAWINQLPDRIKNRILRRWDSMSEEDRERMKNRWSNMSDEDKQEMQGRISRFNDN